MIRSFIAIDVPKEIKNKIAKIQMELQPILPKVSWINPPNIHLSLKFLGDIVKPITHKDSECDIEQMKFIIIQN